MTDDIIIDDIDRITDMFCTIFDTDVVIVKHVDTKYTISYPGHYFDAKMQNAASVTFDTSNNTIVCGGKIMEFNDEALEYLQSLRSKT